MLDTPIRKGTAVVPRQRTSALAWLLAREPQAEAVATAGPVGLAVAREALPREAEREPVADAPRAVPHPRRAAAHAAFAAVEGGGPRALDAALGVVEAEARALRLRVIAQEEALKLLRLYATDQWARSVAEQALAAPQSRLAPRLPGYLYDPALAEQDLCTCGGPR